MTLAPDRPATLDPAALLHLTGTETTTHDLPRPRRDWEADAACRLLDPDWLPSVSDREEIEDRRALCATCPAARDCLLAALRADDRHRLAAGTTSGERDRLLQKAGIRRPTQTAADAALKRKPIPPRGAPFDRARAQQLRAQGLTIRDIAIALNVSRHAVREGLPTNRGQAGKNRTDLGPEVSAHMAELAAQGWTVGDIAERYGCAQDTVRRRLKKARGQA